jgi:hypothetical protein
MSGKKGCACCSKEGSARTVLIVLGLLAIAVAVYVAAVVLLGVFSWHGLAYSFGLAAAGPLRFALAVRCTTSALLIELGAAVSLVLDYLEGRRALRLRWAWGKAHVTLVRRIVFATWWVLVTTATLAGDVAAHRLTRRIGQRIGAIGLGFGHPLIRRLADLRTACAAQWHARRRRTAKPVVAVVTTERPEAMTGELVGARIDDAA